MARNERKVLTLRRPRTGQTFTYTLTARNDGPATATGVKLTADLPPGVGLGQTTR